MIDPRMMPLVQGTTAYPHKWANILTAPLSEGAGKFLNKVELRRSIDIFRSFESMYQW
jgi:hypothetical protein